MRVMFCIAVSWYIGLDTVIPDCLGWTYAIGFVLCGIQDIKEILK